MGKSGKTTSKVEGNIKNEEKIPHKITVKGKTAKQMMSKHIQDKNDIITEEDFKNLNIELSLESDTSHQPLVIVNDSERPKDEDKDHKTVTPWDVINE